MDVFYEESSIAKNSEKGARKYKIINAFSYVFLFIWIVLLISTISNIPFSGNRWGNVIFLGLQTLFYFGIWYLLSRWKMTCNVSYDYAFVSGELRISKVFNVNKRRLVVCINCEDMEQIGDVENSSYERLASTPQTKEIVCTSNVVASEGKFFMYIFVNDNDRKLYVLECRELLLMNILKFARRGVLESDYVMQEKKQKQ